MKTGWQPNSATGAGALMVKRTYLDSGVLLAACKGTDKLSLQAMRALDEPERELLVSDAVWLEVMPKAVYERQRKEVAFYEAIFAVAEKLPWNLTTLEHAANLAQQYGIAAMDAIHVAHALDARADELLTAEKRGKPMFRTQGVTVRSIREDAT